MGGYGYCDEEETQQTRGLRRMALLIGLQLHILALHRDQPCFYIVLDALLLSKN